MISEIKEYLKYIENGEFNNILQREKEHQYVPELQHVDGDDEHPPAGAAREQVDQDPVPP